MSAMVFLSVIIHTSGKGSAPRVYLYYIETKLR